MLLRAPDRRWLSSDVQADLLLVCRDGSVSAHSALLAGSSPFLSSLLSQPSTSHCAGCSSPRLVTIAGVGVEECKALVELLYTGKAPLSTDVTRILELCGVLGMDLEGLCVSNSGSGVGNVRVNINRLNSIPSTQDTIRDTDSIDSVHPRFIQASTSKSRSFSHDPSHSVRVPGSTKIVSGSPNIVTESAKIVPDSPKLLPEPNNRLAPETPTKISVIIDPSPSPSHKLTNPLASSCAKTYSNRKLRVSEDTLAEPLKSFPLKKLPIKTPDIPDTILPEVPRVTERGYSELSRTNTPAVLQYLHSPQVMLPDNVLTEVMGMLPDAIKQEVLDEADISCDVMDNNIGCIADISDMPIGAEITYGDGAEDIQDLRDIVDPLRSCPTPPYPMLEGRGDDDSPNSPPVTAYLSMDNARNYVCNNCDQGFTFVRSFNWHNKRCQETGAGSQEENKTTTERILDNIVKLENVQVKVEKIPTKQCVICKKSVNGLKSHLSLVHFKAKIISDYCSNPRQCKICKNPFKSLHGLILHIGVHHNMVKRYLKDHGKEKKGKRIVLEKTRAESFDVVKREVSKERENNVRISVVAEAKEKMKNRLVNRDKIKLKNRMVAAAVTARTGNYMSGDTRRSRVSSERQDVNKKVENGTGKNKMSTERQKATKKDAHQVKTFNKCRNLSVERQNENNKDLPLTSNSVKSIIVSADRQSCVKRKEALVRSGEEKSISVSRDSESGNSKYVSSGKTRVVSRVRKVSCGDGSSVKKSVVSGGRKVSCGVCVKCLLSDCGDCIHCADKPQFGGRGKLFNRVCVKKVCRNKVWSAVMVSPSLGKGTKVKR